MPIGTSNWDVKPNCYKKQCFSSSFLQYLKFICTSALCRSKVLHDHFGPENLLQVSKHDDEKRCSRNNLALETYRKKLEKECSPKMRCVWRWKIDNFALTCPSKSKRNTLTSFFNRSSSFLRSIGLLSIKNFNALIPSSHKPRAIRAFEISKRVDEYITSVLSLSIFNSSSASFIAWSKSFSTSNFFFKYLSIIV